MMNKKNILVIEDDVDMTLLYERILGKEYNILVALDVVTGRKKLNENEVNLIILDLQLPGESGTHFLTTLKKDPKHNHIDVLVITSLEDIWDLVKDSYPHLSRLFKPFEKDDLLDIIRKLEKSGKGGKMNKNE
jgi:DNA-binding NtrC family response regulator